MAYRDDLDAAHRRIDELEARLAGRVRPSVRRPAVVVLACALGVVALGGLTAVMALRSTRLHAVPMATMPRPAPSNLVHDYADALIAPFTPDADGDGVEDVVAMFRDVSLSNPSGPIWVRAVSGRTFESLWTAGPFEDARPSSTIVVGDRVLVRARAELVILDVKTGLALRRPPATGTGGLCPLHGRGHVALVGAGEELDLDTGTLGARAGSEACEEFQPTCALGIGEPCYVDRDENGTLGAGSVHPKHRTHGWTTLVGGPYRVSFGWLQTPALSRDHMIVAGAKRAAPDALWEREATLEDEPIDELEHVTNYQSLMATLQADRFVLAYGTAGGVRVVARNMDTGTLRWTTRLAGRPRYAALRATPTRIYILADWGIHVIDGQDGTVLGTVDTPPRDLGASSGSDKTRGAGSGSDKTRGAGSGSDKTQWAGSGSDETQ